MTDVVDKMMRALGHPHNTAARDDAWAAIDTLAPGDTWATKDGVEVMVVPVEATEEMVRRHLAQEWPALFRTHLRHPDEGPFSRKETESRIGLAVRKWTAMLAAIRKE